MAMTRIVMMMAKTPPKVQKMAAVFTSRALVTDTTCHKNSRVVSGEGEGSYIKQRQPLVSTSRDGIAEESDGEEQQEDLPVVGLEDANAILVLEDIDARGEEESGSKVHGKGDCDLTDEKQPATDPACNATPARRSKHESLVVDTCGTKHELTY